MRQYEYFTSNGIILHLNQRHINSIPIRGNCEKEIDKLFNNREIRYRLSKIDTNRLIQHLAEYGAWSDEELLNLDDSYKRFLWIAVIDIKENPDLYILN